MKRFFICFAFLVCFTLLAFSQIEVVGTGSVSASSVQTDFFFPGGSNKSDYNKIDDGAYECLYIHTVKAEDKAGSVEKENYYCMLDFGKNASRYVDYTVFRADSSVLASESVPELHDKLLSDLGSQNFRFYGDVIMGYPEGELTYTDLVTPDYLEYTEPLGDMKWVIEDETDTVCGYVCTKATVSYGGRDWIAWFAEDIPSPFGPWKFNGLPGLILKVVDTEGVHEFNAISFKKGNTPIAKPENHLIVKTKRNKFVENKNLFEKSPFKYIQPESISKIDIIKGQVFVNGVAVPKRQNAYVPIELH